MKLVRGDANKASEIITQAVNSALLEGPALLLVSGGSNIGLACSVVKNLAQKNNLTIGLIDERYGPIGHSDSNWQKLMDSGFNIDGINLLPVLNGELFEETCAEYLSKMTTAINSNRSIIGIFGLGTDGHTAGILPNSQSVGADDIVSCYKGPDFMRITLTPKSFNKFDKAFLVAFGDNKKHHLKMLSRENLPTADQPAQALKNAKELVIISDQVGEGAN